MSKHIDCGNDFNIPYWIMFFHNRQMMQQQIMQQQMMISHQARSQEMLHSPHAPHARPMTLGADALYQQYGPPGRRSTLYQRDADVRNMANFTSLKQTASQIQVSWYLLLLFITAFTVNFCRSNCQWQYCKKLNDRVAAAGAGLNL